MRMQVGANEGQVLEIRIPEISAQQMRLQDVNVKTKDAADSAIANIDFAIKYVSNARSRLGAYQNRLEHTEKNIDITSENNVCGNGDSYFFDLYLDVVHIPGEGSVLLDEDELDEALAEGAIDAQLHAMAHREAKRILEGLQKEEARLEEFCREQTLRLKAKMEAEGNF